MIIGSGLVVAAGVGYYAYIVLKEKLNPSNLMKEVVNELSSNE